MLFRLLIILIVSTLPFCSYAQDHKEVPYQAETGLGINFNTNGGLLGGLMFKRSVYQKKNAYRLFYFEVVNVKNPKELRYASQVTGNSFVYFKTNYLFSFRPMFGKEFLLFHKAEEEGIQVSALVAGGISIGLIKPYAIQYDYTVYTGNPGPPTDVRNEPYDPAKHVDAAGRILGTGGLFTAIGKSKIRPGLCAKASLSFEIANSNTGVEAGGLIEVFNKNIPLMANSPNYNYFASVFINIFYTIHN